MTDQKLANSHAWIVRNVCYGFRILPFLPSCLSVPYFWAVTSVGPVVMRFKTTRRLPSRASNGLRSTAGRHIPTTFYISKSRPVEYSMLVGSRSNWKMRLENLDTRLSSTRTFVCRTCADRQAGTESDGYTAEEKLRLCQAWLYAACPNTVFNEGDEVRSAHQHTTMR